MRSPCGLPLAALRVQGNRKGEEHLGSPMARGSRREGRWQHAGLVADRRGPWHGLGKAVVMLALMCGCVAPMWGVCVALWLPCVCQSP